MCSSIGLDAELVTSSKQLADYPRVVLPGVGHFDACVVALERQGFFPMIQDYYRRSVGPILGVCVGGQVLGRESEEGGMTGLSLLPMSTRRIVSTIRQVPHMGWSDTKWSTSSPFSSSESTRYYYSHSYEMRPEDTAGIAATLQYDGSRVAAVYADGVMPVQFHPEKSHRFGKSLFEWFSGWRP